ncbi:MAG TPA: endonuclease/exonuclease/phosphatase family protein [Mycobacteriales bacterium]|nr:endonuclease/exonuclease/phosphatase family protein [Mycobacteriales bacterium]
MPTTLRVVTYNLLNGGVDDGDDRRWRTQLDMLASLAADVVVVQEAKHWDRDGAARMFATANTLGLQPLLARSASHGCHLVVLHRWPKVRGVRFDPAAGCTAFHHALARVHLRITGFDEPVRLLATHLDPFSGDHRLAEAGWLTTTEYTGGHTIVAGDLNCIGATDPEPDWDALDGPHIHRRLIDPDGRLGRADRRAMRVLLAEGYHDPQAELGLPLSPTAGHQDGEPGRRSDYILLSGALLPALVGYRTIDTPTTRTASDHLPVIADLDLDALGR